jgi:hypothetical protein
MRKKLKHTFIPHQGNGYKPAMFEYAGMSVILGLGIIFYMSSLTTSNYITTTEQGAAVYAAVLVDLTNQDRITNNQPILAISDVLTKAAQMKADDMAAKQYFSHTSPDGTTPWYWFQKANYNFVYAGENLAVDFTESADIEKAWLASPKHRDNIIDPRFTEIGIATKTANWQGRQTTFVVQLFGAPATVVPVMPKNNTPTLPTAQPTKPAASSEVTTIDGVKVASASEAAVLETPTQASSPKIQVISETESTILGLNAEAQGYQAAEVTTPTASWFDKVLVRIPNISNFALRTLAIAVLIGLMLFVFVEIRRQHPKHVIIGIFVFIAISSLAYTSQAFTLPI